MTGEFLYFAVYVVQQLGVMLGVGAQTVLLCTHLVAVHRNEQESPRASYARAARIALGTGLVFIIVSGLAATGLHVLNAQMEVVLAPAFLFKWALIALLTVTFFLQRVFPTSNIFYAFTGGTWFALFLVHSLGPVASWETLGLLYGAWLVLFAMLWATFVGLMHWRRTPAEKVVPVMAIKKEIPKPKEIPKVELPVSKPVVQAPPPKPALVVVPPPIPPKPPAPPPVPKPMVAPISVVVAKPIPPAPHPISVVEQPVLITVNATPTLSWWQRLLALLPKRKAPVVELPTLPPLPIPVGRTSISITPLSVAKPVPPPQPTTPVQTPAPAVVPIVPVIQPLSLQAAHTTPSAPAPTVIAPVPVEKSLLEEIIDHLHVPALRIMPRTVEDIGKQNRPPVVKL